MEQYINPITNEYPITRAIVQARNPNVSLGANWQVGLELVHPAPRPATKRWELAVEGPPALTDKGHWEQTWSVIDVQSPELLAQYKAERKREIEAKRDNQLLRPFAIPEPHPGQGQHLRRNEDDRINWLTLDSACKSAIMGGNPGMLVSLRTEENNVVTMTAQQCVALLLALAVSGQQIMSYAWTLKETLANAADCEAVCAIDINNGWPE